jgi:hypothetical protein
VITGVAVGVAMKRVAFPDVPPPGAGVTTAAVACPTLACSAEVSWNVSCVALTYVVAWGTPPTCTTDDGEKFVPVTVIGVGVVLASTTFGVNLMPTPGAGFVIPSIRGLEVPPPGALFTAVNDKLPLVATSAVVSATVTCVLLTKDVVRALPFTLITVVVTKPVPVTVTVWAAPPRVTVVGLKDAIVGAGLFTCRFTAVPEPLLVDPFTTMTESCPPAANCDDCTTAVSCVLLT